MRALLTILIGSLLLAALPLASSQAGEQKPRPTPPRVRLKLIAQRDAVAPGDEFLVGLRYKLAPHWHVYWKNPGDSGLATEATLSVPDGFEVGPLVFPGPQRIVLPGDVVNYGYEDEVVLFWTVTAPDELGEAAEFRFEARSEWLVCREECERGQGTASLALRRATQDHPARSDDAVFGASLARLPLDYANLEGATACWEGTAESPVLVQQLPGSVQASFFPEREAGLELERTALERTNEHSTLRRWYSFRPTEEHPRPRVRGLLLVEGEDREVYYDLDLGPAEVADKETR